MTITVTRKRFTAKVKFKVVGTVEWEKDTGGDYKRILSTPYTTKHVKERVFDRGEGVFETKDKTEEQSKKEVEKLYENDENMCVISATLS